MTIKSPNDPNPIDLGQKLGLFDARWTPHRIAKFDGHQLLLAKVEGEFVWHAHADHDEVFLPLKGQLLMDFRDGTTRKVGPGQVLVVPRGVEHRPRTEPGEEVHLLVVDPLDVQHTGGVESELTVEEYPEI